MTYEEFLLRNQRINESLDAIATRTANMAWAQSAHTDNPDFVELMKAQDFLLNESEKLLNAIMSSSGG